MRCDEPGTGNTTGNPVADRAYAIEQIARDCENFGLDDAAELVRASIGKTREVPGPMGQIGKGSRWEPTELERGVRTVTHFFHWKNEWRIAYNIFRPGHPEIRSSSPSRCWFTWISETGAVQVQQA
jgi:hypothetical protein